MPTCRLRLGKRDSLRIEVNERYVHLLLTQPGRAQFTQEIYIPRKSWMKVLLWLVRATKKSPRRSSHYPPDAMRRYIAEEMRHVDELRRQRRERYGTRRRRRSRRG